MFILCSFTHVLQKKEEKRASVFRHTRKGVHYREKTVICFSRVLDKHTTKGVHYREKTVICFSHVLDKHTTKGVHYREKTVICFSQVLDKHATKGVRYREKTVVWVFQGHIWKNRRISCHTCQSSKRHHKAI